jgi:hypothetical protein
MQKLGTDLEFIFGSTCRSLISFQEALIERNPGLDLKKLDTIAARNLVISTEQFAWSLRVAVGSGASRIDRLLWHINERVGYMLHREPSFDYFEVRGAESDTVFLKLFLK